MEQEKQFATVRLNKFISNAGLCARRTADLLIQAGHITVNDQQVRTLGYQVAPQDVVKYRNQPLSLAKHVYVLLNKPKGYITTMHDPQGRKTVAQLVQHACKERIYPVGRLDRNTTGLLLFTNHGVLAKQLAHPACHIPKLYHVVLDKPITLVDFEKVRAGVPLEDGVAHVDRLAIVDPQDRSSIGLELHMGRNRVIRRLFAQLGYTVIKLDRVQYDQLTKKNLPRGQWRLLTPQEVRRLRSFLPKAVSPMASNELRVR